MVEDKLKESIMSPEQEIQDLERKLEEKKRQLVEKGESQFSEKEALREVLQEHVEEAKQALSEPTGSVPAVSHILTDDLQNDVTKVKGKEKREEQLKQLVEVALTKSIKDAVSVAKKSNPYLLDELHDHLVDDYYDKLIALRRIKKL